MRILSVSDHCCMRVLKQGIALEKRGIEMVYMSKRVANSGFYEDMKYYSTYIDHNHFAQKIQRYKDIDLIHVHNEPDWMGHIAKQFRPDLPVVFDAHDLFSARLPHAADKFGDEDRSFKKCDAFVYPSIGYKEHSLKLYKKYNIKNRPNLVLYSMCNEEWLVDTPLPRIHSLVYEGGLRVKEQHPAIPDNMKYHQYRDFNEVFKWLSSRNIPITAFSANVDGIIHHGESGALVTPAIPYQILTKQLSRFDWGIVGSPIPDNPQWKHAMPHKLFECIAAGTPVIGFHAKELCNFIEKHKIGIVVDDWKDIPDVYDQHEKYRRNLLFLQQQFVMERHIQKLIDLYKELV